RAAVRFEVGDQRRVVLAAELARTATGREACRTRGSAGRTSPSWTASRPRLRRSPVHTNTIPRRQRHARQARAARCHAATRPDLATREPAPAERAGATPRE